MRLGTRLEYVGSSLRVSGACHDCTREFTGRRPRLIERLSGVAKRLVGSLTAIEAIELWPNDVPRSSLGIKLGSDDAVRPRYEFARRFAKGIGKLVGNTSGDHRKKTEYSPQECRGLLDWLECFRRLTRPCLWLNHP
ncbi:hypothetical protein BHM03_00062162 [Ensete ventricosum]|nr:hypothetical protein BHM03_00062162 [Ensete ventricosum]